MSSNLSLQGFNPNELPCFVIRFGKNGAINKTITAPNSHRLRECLRNRVQTRSHPRQVLISIEDISQKLATVLHSFSPASRHEKLRLFDGFASHAYFAEVSNNQITRFRTSATNCPLTLHANNTSFSDSGFSQKKFNSLHAYRLFFGSHTNTAVFASQKTNSR